MTTATPLFFHTLNCGKAKHSTPEFADSITDILPEDPPTLFVFGFQEVAPIIDGCFDHLNDYLDPLLGGIELSLSEAYGPTVYKEIGRQTVGAIALVCYGNHISFTINKVVGASVGCGYFRSSLKGAASILADLSIGKFVFVNAHLTANEGNLEYRNQDFLNIVTMLDFGNGYGAYQPNSHFFFMGDLNYRVTKDPFSGNDHDDSASVRLLATTDIDYRSIDELTIEREAKNTLYGFTEPDITFKPTFKFYENDLRYNMKRLPSWCDRILYLPYDSSDNMNDDSSQHHQAVVHAYNAIFNYMVSDHRPVYLHISIPETPPPSPLTSQVTWHSSKYGIISLGLSPYLTLNKLVGYASDQSLGYGIYAATTKRGRVFLGLGLVLLFIAYLIL